MCWGQQTPSAPCQEEEGREEEEEGNKYEVEGEERKIKWARTER